MAKAMSAIEKFKKVEAALREIALTTRRAMEQIDLATTEKRTALEREALTAARLDCLRLQDEARGVVGDFFDRVEGRTIAPKVSEKMGEC